MSSPPAAKRLKTEDLIGTQGLIYATLLPFSLCHHYDILLGEDPDELEVYGSDVQSGPMLASYKFEVCDSVLNIGPIVDSTIGEPAFLSVSQLGVMKFISYKTGRIFS